MRRSRSIRSRARCCSRMIGQTRDEPEGADQEAALLAREPVVGLAGPVAQDVSVLGEVVRDCQHALAEHLVITRQEAEQGGQQGRSVEGVGVVVLPQDPVPYALVEDVLADLLGRGTPFAWSFESPRISASCRGPVHRDPAHELRGDVVLRLAARLPDSLVGLLPDLRRALGLRLHHRPEPPGQPLAAAAVQQDRVERSTEHVVLALVEGAVSDPHRRRPRIPGQIISRRLGQVAASVDPVHDLQSRRPRPARGRPRTA